MKKGTKLLSTALLAGGSVTLLVTAFTATGTSFRLFAEAPRPRPDAMNCNYYWQEVKYGFKDIYSIVETEIRDANSASGPSLAKETDMYTWGTVTSKWLNDNNQVCLIIQSRSALRQNAAIQLTACVNSISTFAIGNVVEVMYYPSSVTLATGQLPQIGRISQGDIETQVSLAYETNPWSVVSIDVTRELSQRYSEDQAYHGLLKCHTEKVMVSSIDTSNNTALIYNGALDYSFTVDFGGMATETANILEKLQEAKEKDLKLSLGGYFFSYRNRDVRENRLLLRDARDIEF